MPVETLSGQAAETLACSHLQEAGLTLLLRNFKCARGEIDLVMDDGGTVVFIEVRYRRSGAFGTAAETVDTRKQSRLTAAAQYYLLQRRQDVPCRFDVVAITGVSPPRIDWLRDAFRPE